jgi:hypothetical protein
MKVTMRKLFFIAAVVAFLVLGILAFENDRRGKERGITIDSRGPVVEELAKFGDLVTTKISITDILDGQSATHRGVFLIKGDALIGVDMLQAVVAQKDETAKTATIRLPAPHVIQARVDHEESKTWDVSRTTWIPFIGDEGPLRDEAMRQAQRLVEFAARGHKSFGESRRHAELVIKQLYGPVGWDVRVLWNDVKDLASNKKLEKAE